jgi:hypothetical protein
MQRQRAADKQPGHHCGREAGNRSQRQGRQQYRVLLQPTFEHDGKPARNQFGMAARDRDETIG